MNTKSRRLLTMGAVSLLIVFGLATAVVLGLGGEAQASVLIPLSVEQLDQASATVVAAQVIGTEARMVGSASAGGPRGYIETVVQLKVLRALKGASEAPGDKMTIVVPGGTVGALTLVVDSAPVFQVGETAVLYLDARGRVVGGQQGKRALSVLEAALYGAGSTAGAFGLHDGDVAGWADVGSASTPTITSTSPSSGSAGTGTEVSISGAGFGTSQGTGHVDFFYRTGAGTIQASIVSWSDTAIVCVIPTGTVSGYAASAGSGPVTVTNADGVTSAGYDFQVTFGYGGHKWSTSTCTYRVNPNTADTTTEDALVDDGAAVWNSASAFAFGDGGATGATTWSYDGANEIFWTSNLATGILGQAWTWYSGTTILETDIGFNDSYAWGSGAMGTFDIESVAIHELGHWLSLRDLYGSGDSAKVMYGFAGSGQVKRTLDAGDTAGIQWIYGGGGGGGGGGATQVTLSTTVVGSGSITRSPDQSQFDQGSSVTLTAVPASGWVFAGWSGDATGGTNPLTMVMDSSKSITATFTEETPLPVTRYEQTDSRLYFAGAWSSLSGSYYSGRSYKYTNSSGAAVTVAFNGTAIDYIAKTASSLGWARLTLDGGDPVYVDLYSSSTKYKQKVWGVSGLAPGDHILLIEWTGTRGSGTGTTINLDAVDIMGTLTNAPRPPVPTRYEQTDPRLYFAGAWSSLSGSYYSGRSYKYTNSSGAAVTVAFNGTAIDYIAKTASSLGLAKLTLDGGDPVYVDLCSPSTRYKQKVWGVSGLAPGDHILLIEWTGTRGSGTGTTINLDAVDVLGTLVSAR